MNENNTFTEFANEFLKKRQAHSCTTSLKMETISYLNELIDFLFPHFSKKVFSEQADVAAHLQILRRDLTEVLKLLNGKLENNVEVIADSFIRSIPEVHLKLWQDAEEINSGDPAAESIDEVILAYPGFMAITIYRLAHQLYLLNVPIIPRIMTEHAHQITGIDIHPGAEIDSPFFIDHGTGIVIGETTVIGKNVKIYQGVTLGALSVGKSLAKVKRHPTIEDGVIIYSQAVILGGNTVIGKNSVIGGNSWITESIPANSVVYHKNEVRIKSNVESEEVINFSI
ncbi:MAG: serine acetyltransferase [Ignavibacteriaceae bacterium]|nr:serine acetyltransferase [Ignavibacteriaceae bacterium]